MTTTAYKPADIPGAHPGRQQALARCEGVAGLRPHPLQHDRGAGQGAAGAVAQGVLRAARSCGSTRTAPCLSDGRAAMLAEWSVGLKHSNQP
ncbi:MAG: hypothetical protein IPJ18_09530 [Betaproteobacteria bacterium]|nr:hypothetical protein [Betaproteobacteria bacterium]